MMDGNVLILVLFLMILWFYGNKIFFDITSYYLMTKKANIQKKHHYYHGLVQNWKLMVHGNDITF